MLRSEVLQTFIQNHPLGLLEGFKQTVESRKNAELGLQARLKEDYLGRIDPTTDSADFGVNAVNCISLYNTVCQRLREADELSRSDQPLSPVALRNLTRAIEAICLRLDIGLEDLVGWNRVPPPWDAIKPRSRVIIAMCERPHERLESQQRRGSATAFSVHDTYAFIHLHSFFSSLPSRPTVEHLSVPFGMSVDAVERKLKELLSGNPAAIVTVGSVHGNPLTGACINRVLNDVKDGNLPAQFIWSASQIRPCSLIDRQTDSECPDPGIRLASGRFLTRSCEPDGLPDTGMLIIDCRLETILCCLAGHGGVGTLATTSALLETSQVAGGLKDNGGVMKDRLMQVVEVAGRDVVEGTTRTSRRYQKVEDDEWIPADRFWQMKIPAWWRYVR